MKDDHKKKSDGLSIDHKIDPWGESSPLQRAMGLEFTIRKSDGVKVNDERKSDGVDPEKKSDGVRVDHEKKSNGVRIHHKRKSDKVKDDHKKTSDGLSVDNEIDRWGESSPLQRAMG